MAVSKSLRHQIMRRDNHTCRYCGAQAPDVKLTIDHVTPQTLGGQDVPENLVAACVDCNAGKSASPPDAALVADVDQRAVEWAHAMEIAVEQRAAELAAERGRTDAFDQEWRRWNAGDQEIWRDQNWRPSVLRLLAAGLTDEFLVDAVGIAMRSKVKPADTWRYFCGVCWREVDKIQGKARQLLGVPKTGVAVDPERSLNVPGYGLVTWTEEDEQNWDSHNEQLRELAAQVTARDFVMQMLLGYTGEHPARVQRISEIVSAASAEAERLFDYGVPTPAKITQAEDRLAQYVAEQLVTIPRPVKPQFDDMAVFGALLDAFAEAVGVSDQVRKLADRCLWDGVPAAHDSWREACTRPRSEGLDDDEEDGMPTDAAIAAMHTVIAPDLAEIRARSRQIVVPHGAE
jgi:hypothetical protein